MHFAHQTNSATMSSHRHKALPPSASNAAVNKKNAAKLPRWAGERVLVVEDMPFNRTLAVALLQRVGLSVGIATNGQEALDQLAAEDFHLVLMDIQMPVMDGLAATQAIRADPRLCELPVIAMTAHATADDQRETRAVGMNAHLTKPINVQALYETLSQWLPPLPASAIPPAAVNADGESRAIDWPEIPGIDASSGLALHANRPQLYLKSLHAFRQDFANAPTQLHQALASGEVGAAQRQAHSLRSVAGALGAQRLADLAREIEYALANPSGMMRTEPLLARINDEFRIIINGLSQLPPLPSLTILAKPLRWDELEPRFEHLAAMLAVADGQSEAQFGELRNMLAGCPTMNDECEQKLTEIAALIDDVEYESALEKLSQLRLSQLRQTMKKNQA